MKKQPQSSNPIVFMDYSALNPSNGEPWKNGIFKFPINDVINRFQ